jgi:hypothetical protein
LPHESSIKAAAGLFTHQLTFFVIMSQDNINPVANQLAETSISPIADQPQAKGPRLMDKGWEGTLDC